MDPGCRHHRQTVVRPPGRGGGWLQSRQTRPPLAQLPQLPDRQPEAGAGCRGPRRQPDRVETWRARPVGPAGPAGAGLLARAAPRHTGWGNEAVMREAEQRDLAYLFRIRLTANVRRAIERAVNGPWSDAGHG